ncbi:BRCT domain-containing protein At4g02110 isoform X2 [Quercus robur]|uniref:BRCT domain-containing protein At4g02110 isoform X2 n=1 Tax=Quercus robur TaxID=38942 RepID=UPI002161B2FD|nr:BRCT domain-containing protein At4g02110 isoform X2 [Quercus robur]
MPIQPLKDLNGIPGAKNLIICLTGYQRQDRDDVMTMVNLMGAQFSKPLVANKVTHLICYKFEGEKYELAKKIHAIKLVSHRWLEDCLKDWKLLPELNYNKSGYELEILEAEAKDSEEEAGDTVVRHSGGKDMNKSPHNSKIGVSTTSELPPRSVGELSIAPKGPLNVDNTIEKSPGQASSFDNFDVLKALRRQNTSSDELPDPLDGTPDHSKVGNDLKSTPGSAKRSTQRDGKFSPLRRSSIPMYSGEVLGNLSDHSKMPLGKVNDDFYNFSLKMEQVTDRFGSGHLETSMEETNLVDRGESSGLLPQKSTVDVSCAGFKSPKVSLNVKPCITRSPVVGDKIQVLELTTLIDGPGGTNSYFPLGNNDLSKDEAANPNAAPNSFAKILTTKTSIPCEKSLTCDMPFSEIVTTKTGQGNFVDEKTPQSSLQSLRKSASCTRPDIVDFDMGESVVGEKGKQENEKQNVESSPSNKKLETLKSDKPGNLSMLEGGNDLFAKPIRKKMAARKTLGSRYKSTTNNIQKNKATSQNDAVVHSVGVKETADHEKSSVSMLLEISPPTDNIEPVKEVEMRDALKSGDDRENNNELMDDETEAPEDRLEHELEKPLSEEKSGLVTLTDKEDTIMEENSDKGSEPEKAVCDKKFEHIESTLDGDGVKGKMNKGKKRPIGRTKVKMDIMKSKKGKDGEETVTENSEGTGTEKEERVLLPSTKTKSCSIPANKSENSVEAEKENKPVQNISQGKESVGKSSVNSNMTPRKVNQKAGKVCPNSSTSARDIPNRVKTEPAWFILSGHRLQRKDFQQVIRRLKGKLCRDSHQWSYQATHFITPDPIRRTEKFFAAVASGRWILKTDYLTACSQAGRFLAEESYEWYKNGLNEDGAINLEAPRKWRHMREKTGHGAFYGMRIIIYGECIAPTLDTLKRAVKAGDGTILATSPPYTRFLNDRVDFAIISPGMPHVDLWVQEFMKHEIPCVLADYIVEYVCKPGYSLDKHVLYNTHAWAEKSFAYLQSKAEEIVKESTDSTPSDDNGSNDIACTVCGSHDKGEVMLICGNESGSVGCGVGTHIDCCNPPLQEVPEDDWFCPKCSGSRHSTNSAKRKKKGSSLLKRK